MKDGYRYQDGKVLVTDYSNGNEREIEVRHYQDNIDEILITENVLEKLNSEYNKMIDIDNETYDCLGTKKSEIPMMFFTVVMFTLIFGGLLSFLLSMVIKPLITLFCFFVTLLGAVYKSNIKPTIEEVKKLKKTLRGYDFTIESVEKEIEKNKKKLKELQDDISRDKLDNNNDNMNSVQSGEYIQLDYVNKLKELREYLGLCYVVGYSQEELSKWYEPETLNEILEKNIDKEQVKVLKREFLDKMKNR